MAAGNAPRTALFRWLGWFAMANAVLLGVISLLYMAGAEPGREPLAWVYLLTIYFSHHALLALLPLLLVVAPVIALVPRRRLVFVAAILVLACMVAVMTLDSLLWSQSRFHLNLLTAQILGAQSWIFAAVMFVIALGFESILAGAIWRWLAGRPRAFGRPLALMLTISLLVAQGIYAWSDASYFTPVTRLGNQLPVHTGITAKKWLYRLGLVDLQQSRERQLARRMSRGTSTPAGGLNYPLQPMRCGAGERLNLLVIIIDSLRSDVLDASTAPTLTRLAASEALDFQQHFSGGNSSRMGLFSFFYGLPPGYFSSFEAIQRPPVLMDELQRQGYRLGIFSSADLYRPVMLDKTAFANVPGLRVAGDESKVRGWPRDIGVTEDWMAWLDAHQGPTPFFGFLYYDAPRVNDFPPDYPLRFDPPSGHPRAEEFAEYQTAVHFSDSQVAAVLQHLEQGGWDRNTVVLISSDHGEEFSESGPGFDRHGSGFSRYQLQVPLIIRWPGMNARRLEHRTSHYDVAPTLLRRLLSCANEAADFSSGRDLLAGISWEWLIAGSYYNYAVIERDRITVTFPNGTYEVRDRAYRLIHQPSFDAGTLQAVMQENRRFHR